MTHAECDSLLVELSYGELPPDVARKVEAHVAGCEACTRALAGIRATLSAVRSLPPEEPPEAGVESLLAYAGQQAARMKERRRGFLPHWLSHALFQPGWALAGIAVTVGIASYAFVQMTRPRSIDDVPLAAPASAPVPAAKLEEAMPAAAPPEQPAPLPRERSAGELRAATGAGRGAGAPGIEGARGPGSAGLAAAEGAAAGRASAEAKDAPAAPGIGALAGSGARDGDLAAASRGKAGFAVDALDDRAPERGAEAQPMDAAKADAAATRRLAKEESPAPAKPSPSDPARDEAPAAGLAQGALPPRLQLAPPTLPREGFTEREMAAGEPPAARAPVAPAAAPAPPPAEEKAKKVEARAAEHARTVASAAQEVEATFERAQRELRARRLDEALALFLEIADRHPGSRRAPDALLAAAEIERSRGHAADADALVQRLLRSYGSSDAARRARTR